MKRLIGCWMAVSIAINLPRITTNMTTDANAENLFLSKVAAFLDEEGKFTSSEERQPFIDLVKTRMKRHLNVLHTKIDNPR